MGSDNGYLNYETNWVNGFQNSGQLPNRWSGIQRCLNAWSGKQDAIRIMDFFQSGYKRTPDNPPETLRVPLPKTAKNEQTDMPIRLFQNLMLKRPRHK